MLCIDATDEDIETIAVEFARESGKTLPTARAALRAARGRLARTLGTDRDLAAMAAEVARRHGKPIASARAALREAMVRLAKVLTAEPRVHAHDKEVR